MADFIVKPTMSEQQDDWDRGRGGYADSVPEVDVYCSERLSRQNYAG